VLAHLSVKFLAALLMFCEQHGTSGKGRDTVAGDAADILTPLA
jgi:hypothetical protein